MQNDPYATQPKSWYSPPTVIVPITPNDAADLPQGIHSLRIWNPTGAAAAIRVTLTGAPDTPIDLPVPEGLTIEFLRIQRVYATGSTADLVLHGYSEPWVAPDDSAH